MPIPQDYFGMRTSAQDVIRRELDRQREYMEMEMRRQRQYLEMQYQQQALQPQMHQHSHTHKISVRRIKDPMSFKEYEIRTNHRTGREEVIEIPMMQVFENGEGRNELITEEGLIKKLKNRRKLFWARYKQNNLIKSLITA